MSDVVVVALVVVAAMVIYAVFAYLRRASRDPERERAQLAETDRRISQIERDETI